VYGAQKIETKRLGNRASTKTQTIRKVVSGDTEELDRGIGLSGGRKLRGEGDVKVGWRGRFKRAGMGKVDQGLLAFILPLTPKSFIPQHVLDEADSSD
jgi:hypothetical protein